MNLPSGEEHSLRFQYAFAGNKVEIFLNFKDLAILLRKIDAVNLNSVNFDLSIELEDSDGQNCHVSIPFPEEVLEASSQELMDMDMGRRG